LKISAPGINLSAVFGCLTVSTMSSNPGSARENKTLGCFPFVIGGLSFIPLLGVLFGLIAIVWGLSAWRGGGKKLALVGAAGIGFTILVYGALFYFGFAQRGGVYDDLRMKPELSRAKRGIL
jgi:hypothetical protein